jgi:hypothetical protein
MEAKARAAGKSGGDGKEGIFNSKRRRQEEAGI